MIQLYNGDCAKIMQQFPDNYIDLTVTSPPYDNLRAYKGFTFNFEAIADQLYRITKPGGVVVWVVGDATIKGSETGTSFRQALYFKEIGFNLHDTMIYLKNGFSFPESNRYPNVFEYMFVFSKNKPKTFNPIKDRLNKNRGKKITGTARQKDGSLKPVSGVGKVLGDFGVRFNVWKYQAGKYESTSDEIAYKHPAIFPEKLAEDHILSWSNPGDIVFDPMVGSGTTGKMAVLNNRDFIGIEISQEYLEIAKQRITEAERQLKLSI
jgi:DNA modification methylase